MTEQCWGENRTTPPNRDQTSSIYTRSTDNLWKCTQCIVSQRAAAFIEKKKEWGEAEYGHKAYLYTTWRYVTFQFHLNDTWLSKEVQRERVCVPQD